MIVVRGGAPGASKDRKAGTMQLSQKRIADHSSGDVGTAGAILSFTQSILSSK